LLSTIPLARLLEARRLVINLDRDRSIDNDRSLPGRQRD
jgi:hypothetical protein